MSISSKIAKKIKILKNKQEFYAHMQDGHKYSDKDIQYEKYLFHRRQFRIVESPLFLSFERLIDDEKTPFSLECSCKLNDTYIFPGRFNVWYKDKSNFHQNILSIISFFRDISKTGYFKIDVPRFKEIIDRIDLVKTSQIIVGVDFRETLSDSRIKLWLIVKNDHEMVSDILKRYDVERQDFLKESMISDDLLFGFDFYPSGKIDTKIYPLYTEKDIPVLIGKKIVPNDLRILRILEQTRSFHISFKTATDEKIYHLRPKDEMQFISHLKNESISSLFSQISVFPYRNKMIISLSEKEIIVDRIRSANIYY